MPQASNINEIIRSILIIIFFVVLYIDYTDGVTTYIIDIINAQISHKKN